MNKKVRLTNEDRAKVRGTLAQYLVNMGLDEDTAVAAVTHGPPSMADAIGRRIARGPGYAATREVTPAMFNLAFAEWIAYKCGIRDEAAPAPAEEDAATESVDAEPEAEAAPPASPREALERAGATNIEEYSLVNNYGFMFDLDCKKYDARFWANCYGTALNRWEVMSRNKREDDPRFVYPVDPELKARLESALNATPAA
jgi:hypothetical protein